MTAHGDTLEVNSNGLPVKEPTGRFPIARDDPAYRYDTNPNAIESHNLAFAIPESPVKADSPGCLPMGMIGFTVTGVAIYSALDDAGRDAAAHEIQDLCDGHPQGKGQYHYHSASPCMPGAESNSVVGWALDGYPILGMHDEHGKLCGDRQNWRTQLHLCIPFDKGVSLHTRLFHRRSATQYHPRHSASPGAAEAAWPQRQAIAAPAFARLMRAVMV